MSSKQQILRAEQEARSKELIQRANEPQAPFRIAKNDLVRIAAACQDRNFSEEIDLLEQNGGEKWIEEGLCTNFKGGIKADHPDLEHRTFAFQNNEKPILPLKGFFELLLNALNDFTLKILIVAAVVSIGIEVGTSAPEDRSHAWIEGFAILVAVFTCSSVTAGNDYQKERQFQKLNQVADDRKVVTVMRNGINNTIHMSKVMVGDLIILTEGMEIPADGFLTAASELTTDESAMTGETDPVKKETLIQCINKRNEIIQDGGKNTAGKHDVASCIIMSGTRILNGEGKMIVIVVGDSSCVGKISALLRQSDPEETPLQIKLATIAEDIGKFGMYAAIAVLLVMLIRFTIERVSAGEFKGHHVGEMLDFFILAITVIVVAIPEGLPLAVTLSLAYSVKQMLTDQNLVRKMQACETMGGANNICSDKTGTLTKNLMTLTTWWNHEYQDFQYEQKKMDINQYMPKEFQELFYHQCALNSTAQLRPDEKGSKTEVAILTSLEKYGQNYETIREQYSEAHRIPFSSKRKRMSCIVDYHGKKRIYVKGASEMVLRCCTKYHNKTNQQIVNLDEQIREEVNRNIKRMADNALRTICIAYKELSPNDDITTKDDYGVFKVETENLVLMGIFGIADVIRPEVPHAVFLCKAAGIKVRMVTGDNKDTARAIALQCGIIEKDDPNALVLEGPEFIQRTGGVVCKKCQTFECDCPRDRETAKQLGRDVRVDTIKNGEEFDKIYPYLCVMARSRPEDKYALVTGLIERDNVVAVTGDGTNDAPALKKADVGFAMGIAGTEVAREAAAIILLDDNFKSIVAAVMWGRNIYDSIKKFIQFQLTVNVVAVVITLVGAAVIKQEVLTPIQMLWVNLIMDTLASLALATEPPTEALLYRKPHNRFEYIVSRKMVKHILGQAILQIIVLMIFVFAGEKFLPEYPDTCNDISCFDYHIETEFAKVSAGTRTLVENSKFEHPTKEWPQFLTPTWKARYYTSDLKTVASGRLKSYSGLDKEYEFVEEIFICPSRHFTYVFNVFVMMQICNFLNARKLLDEVNIFEGIFRNYLFLVIIGIIVSLQILIVTFGAYTFHCYCKLGLTIVQWLICIGFALLGNIWSIFLKQIPEKKLIWFNLGWDEMAVKRDEDEEEDNHHQLQSKDQPSEKRKDDNKQEHAKQKQNIQQTPLTSQQQYQSQQPQTQQNYTVQKKSIQNVEVVPPKKQDHLQHQDSNSKPKEQGQKSLNDLSNLPPIIQKQPSTSDQKLQLSPETDDDEVQKTVTLISIVKSEVERKDFLSLREAKDYLVEVKLKEKKIAYILIRSKKLKDQNRLTDSYEKQQHWYEITGYAYSNGILSVPRTPQNNLVGFIIQGEEDPLVTYFSNNYEEAKSEFDKIEDGNARVFISDGKIKQKKGPEQLMHIALGQIIERALQ